jgi:hypothetical protein
MALGKYWRSNRTLCPSPAPGVSTTRRINYLEQNAAAAGFVLSPAEIAELDALFPPEAIEGGRYPEAGMVGLSKCNKGRESTNALPRCIG